MQVAPYLFFNGKCEEAITHYAKILGAEVEAMMRAEDAPADAQAHMGDGMKGKIMHACLKLGDFRIMASDSPPQYFNKPQGFDVSIQIDDLAKAEKIFAALSEGGSVNMPFGKTFWAKGFGGCVDKFGTPWMVNCA
jgi:PhnB protein